MGLEGTLGQLGHGPCVEASAPRGPGGFTTVHGEGRAWPGLPCVTAATPPPPQHLAPQPGPQVPQGTVLNVIFKLGLLCLS